MKILPKVDSGENLLKTIVSDVYSIDMMYYVSMTSIWYDPMIVICILVKCYFTFLMCISECKFTMENPPNKLVCDILQEDPSGGFAL